MGIGAGGLRRGDHLREAGVRAEVGAQEVQGAEAGEVEAQGSEASPRAHHLIHQVGCGFSQFIIFPVFQLENLPKEMEAIQDRGTGELC